MEQVHQIGITSTQRNHNACVTSVNNNQSQVAGIGLGAPWQEVIHNSNFVFSQGKFTDIEELLPAGNTLVWPTVVSINDRGQVLCTWGYAKIGLVDHSKLSYLEYLTK